jgi:hypothetical protein
LKGKFLFPYDQTKGKWRARCSDFHSDCCQQVISGIADAYYPVQQTSAKPFRFVTYCVGVGQQALL